MRRTNVAQTVTNVIRLLNDWSVTALYASHDDVIPCG